MAMARRIYTAEMLAWLRDYAKGRWLEEITDGFNEHFGTDLEPKNMRALLRNHRITSGVKLTRWKEKIHRITTPEQDELVRQRYHESGKGSFKEVQEFLKTLGVSMTLAQVKGYLSRKHIRLGVYGYFKPGSTPANKGKRMPAEVYSKCRPTMLKKGNVPVNHKPVGSERVDIYGYILVKTAEPKTWRQKQRIVWERETGEKLKSSDYVMFLDGNKLNCDIGNLAKVTRSQMARINQNHLRFDNAELTKVGITLAKLLEAKHKKSR